jgi:SNF2 family DNA or RNA helicase
MGLGKTVQSAVALRLVMRDLGCRRALIVTPRSLKPNWLSELDIWGADLTVRRVEGSAEDRRAFYDLPIPVLLVSYEQVRADAVELSREQRFDIVILDEAQRIKSLESATAVACRSIPRARSWCLTGTPVENSAEDLVSIFKFLDRDLLHVGMPRAEVHRLIRPFFLRRLKRDVLPDLPPIIEQDLTLELNGGQREAYVRLWSERKQLARSGGLPVTAGNMLALITRLKQLCNYEPVTGESVKLEALQLVLDNLTAEDDKIIIFSQYVETLQWLRAQIDGIPADLFHGQLDEREREAAISRFRREPGPRVLLVSLKAGGVGLNLQEASTVVLFDRWWNPAAEAQAVNRAHRFGRNRPLFVLRFRVTDSIEDRVAAILEEKQEVIGEYVDEASNATVSTLTRTDLRRILDLGQTDVGEYAE